MADDQDQEDKTEDASERRIEQALERGDVPRSQDLSGFMTLAGGVGATALAFSLQGRGTVEQLAGMMAGAHEGRLDVGVAGNALGVAGLAVAAPMLAIVVAGIAAGSILTKPRMSTEPLMPKANRISPMSGMKRLFGKENYVQFAKTLAKLAAVTAVLIFVLWPERAAIVRLTALDMVAGLHEAGRLAWRVAVSILLLYAAIAAFDAVYQYFAWKNRLRMTLQEVKDEHKETDGNPEIKARIRQIRQQKARQRMMAAVPKATVVIINPTHYSVALRYEKGMPAPVCVAKGVDELALKIREVAKEHRIPLIENVPLARALHASVDVDETIPVEHFKAVAEVIGFVMRARKKR